MTKPTRSSMANNNQETQDKDAIFVNENGYTMGNATTEDSSEIRDLDFYSAIGVNGKKGYIRASEMNGPKTLDEAATYDDSSKDILYMHLMVSRSLILPYLWTRRKFLD